MNMHHALLACSLQEDEAAAAVQRMMADKFDFNDFMTQWRNVNNMGGLQVRAACMPACAGCVHGMAWHGMHAGRQAGTHFGAGLPPPPRIGIEHRRHIGIEHRRRACVMCGLRESKFGGRHARMRDQLA